MSSLLDQIKGNALPSGSLRIAARGALPVPRGEMLEILVYLPRNPVFGEDAKLDREKTGPPKETTRKRFCLSEQDGRPASTASENAS
jgi:hypothetical protein